MVHAVSYLKIHSHLQVEIEKRHSSLTFRPVYAIKSKILLGPINGFKQWCYDEALLKNNSNER